MSPVWISEVDCGDSWWENQLGRVGFLVKRVNHHGASRYLLFDEPPRTNCSHSKKLWGWCGTTNGVAIVACGLSEVVKITRNGRCLLRRVPENRVAYYLCKLGCPELITDEPSWAPSRSPTGHPIAIHCLELPRGWKGRLYETKADAVRAARKLWKR